MKALIRFLMVLFMEKVLQRRSMWMRIDRCFEQYTLFATLLNISSVCSTGEFIMLKPMRRGRDGSLLLGECYHLYPICVYDDAFAEFQLPELLKTPLNSLCLQIKNLQVDSFAEYLSAAGVFGCSKYYDFERVQNM
ncbi:hypothetical protein CARUB_v10002805mg [Capsella rubella]|uniref:Uncharacterized protein n=1 Tax=Capsella rubella TaxID=81985 RepID=R0HEK5_9BRAS|nr:hypothetical protein CARUB_v10002805mg [Capsella rubella]